ncbi:hypothetical protein AWB69_00727 [Caballeronia udeis]|uniref:Uncharacterized protein n=1 Tax=Caballeronia udeis TaxID=1232866 RepID=A0A158F6E5_9BURK|nr:hypothetical protein AWB69_00727 [Caballeronia udeis]
MADLLSARHIAGLTSALLPSQAFSGVERHNVALSVGLARISSRPYGSVFFVPDHTERRKGGKAESDPCDRQSPAIRHLSLDR